MKIVLILVIVILISACTDSAQGRFGSYGDEAQIYCYSGGGNKFIMEPVLVKFPLTKVEF